MGMWYVQPSKYTYINTRKTSSYAQVSRPRTKLTTIKTFLNKEEKVANIVVPSQVIDSKSAHTHSVLIALGCITRELFNLASKDVSLVL